MKTSKSKVAKKSAKAKSGKAKSKPAASRSVKTKGAATKSAAAKRTATKPAATRSIARKRPPAKNTAKSTGKKQPSISVSAGTRLKPSKAEKAKPVNEWAQTLKKAALQNKQPQNTWPGAGGEAWKGKSRP